MPHCSPLSLPPLLSAQCPSPLPLPRAPPPYLGCHSVYSVDKHQDLHHACVHLLQQQQHTRQLRQAACLAWAASLPETAPWLGGSADFVDAAPGGYKCYETEGSQGTPHTHTQHSRLHPTPPVQGPPFSPRVPLSPQPTVLAGPSACFTSPGLLMVCCEIALPVCLLCCALPPPVGASYLA